MKLNSWILLTVAQTALAAPTRPTSVVVDARSDSPASWTRLDAAPSPDQRFTLRIGLKQGNLHLLEDELLAVSDPKSASYGQHWSPSKLANFFAPSDDAMTSVQRWLESSGLDASRMQPSPGRNWVQGSVTVAEAESLLDAKYDHYQHTSDVHALGCNSYAVPAEIRQHIDLIHPTTHLFAPRAAARISPMASKSSKSSKAATPAIPGVAPQNSTASCTALTTLACLRELYNLNGYVQQATSQNSLGIAEYTPERYIQSDFDLFAAEYIPSIVGQKPFLASIDGGNLDKAANSSSGESNLDVQYACGLAPGVPTTLYQTTGSTVLVENYNNWLDALDSSYCNSTLDGTEVDCGTAPLTNVISTSSPYNPSFPASCPFVTTVGATETVLSALGGYSEIASAAFPSGGGLSNIFTLPSYQAEAVTAYMSKYSPSDSGYNTSGNARAFPDLAANGVNFPVFVEGTSTPEDGTSASTPVVAAVITLINDARIAAGKRPVGFINPALYSTAFKDAFNDITTGTNQPTSAFNPTDCQAEGFVSLITKLKSLGTPDFAKLLPLFLALP
ncbi:hypothetical protein RQP46_000526 [Phenoliferia psychrophenolica]